MSRLVQRVLLAVLVGGVWSTALPVPAAAVAEAAASRPPRHVRFAPKLFLHPNEDYWPSSVHRVFQHSDLKWARNWSTDPTIATEIDPGRMSGRNDYRAEEDGHTYKAGQCTRPRGGCSPRANGLDDDEGFYVEMNNDYRAGIRSKSQRRHVYRGAPIYWQRRKLQGGGFAITYYFFYEYNAKYPINHEGEWERISVRFRRSGRPRAVAYYKHACTPVVRRWSKVRKDGTHAKVFVAEGGHASYPRPGNHDICGVSGGPFDTDYTSAKGKRWATWKGRVLRVQNQAWYGFGGAWGTVGEFSSTTGPLGPSRYKDPTPWDER